MFGFNHEWIVAHLALDPTMVLAMAASLDAFF